MRATPAWQDTVCAEGALSVEHARGRHANEKPPASDSASIIRKLHDVPDGTGGLAERLERSVVEAGPRRQPRAGPTTQNIGEASRPAAASCAPTDTDTVKIN